MVVVDGLDELAQADTAHEVRRWLRLAAGFGHADARYLIARRSGRGFDAAGDRAAPAGEHGALRVAVDAGHAAAAGRPEQVQDPEFFDEVFSCLVDPPRHGTAAAGATGQSSRGGPVEEDSAGQAVPGDDQGSAGGPAAGPVARVEAALTEGFTVVSLRALYLTTRTALQRALEQPDVDPWQRFLDRADLLRSPREHGELPEVFL
ncbi:hypothetical protein [Streptomyces europaeiscabiei]|uniref:hypothetical protein n=1 Tax=Streptomyces europaeiscabiei TaxID=146819 RepID=UPI0038F76109